MTTSTPVTPEVQFQSLPYYTASALERASKRGAFTLTLEEDRTLEPCSVTVLRDVLLMMWTDDPHSPYLLMVGHMGEMALKVYLTPPLMANLYRATRPKQGFLELLFLEHRDGRTTLTLKRGDGPAFPYALEPDETLQVGLRESSTGGVYAHVQIDALSSGGRVRRRVLSATSETEAVLEQVWAYMGNGPTPMRPRGAKLLDWAV